MSTKINIRSPFYLKYSEPELPSVALTCTLINLQFAGVNMFGDVQLPSTDYGTIVSYTSSDSGFVDGRYATVSSATNRTIVFTISIPTNFSNASDDTINCSVTVSQPVLVCSGGVTNNGTIPNKALNTGGGSLTINLASFFSAGSDPIVAYNITNNNLDFFQHSLAGNILTIFSQQKAGTKKLYVEATDGKIATCDATQPVQITTTSIIAYDCNDTYFSGGSIAQNGTIVNPILSGTITAIRSSSGGSTITSYPANTTGSARNVTLFFVITVPTGYSNTSASIECSKVFSQPTASLPTFTCSLAALTTQSITSFGSIGKGIANRGTITAFSPIGFGGVTQDTSRNVDFTVTVPSSGFSNSGGSALTCRLALTQPANVPVVGTKQWYIANSDNAIFMTDAQLQAAYPNTGEPQRTNLSKEKSAEQRGYSSVVNLQPTRTPIILASDTPELNVNTFVIRARLTDSFKGNIFKSVKTSFGFHNSSGGMYFRIGRNEQTFTQSPDDLQQSFYVLINPSGMIVEVWSAEWTIKKFIKIS